MVTGHLCRGSSFVVTYSMRSNKYLIRCFGPGVMVHAVPVAHNRADPCLVPRCPCYALEARDGMAHIYLWHEPLSDQVKTQLSFSLPFCPLAIL